MLKISAFAKQHPLLAFSALTFAISWGGIILAVGPVGTSASEEQAAMLLVISYIAMLAGPSVGGILLTRALKGRAGFRELVSRLLKWRVGIRWYTLAFLAAPLLMVMTLLTLSLTSPEFLPRLFTEEDRAILFQFSIVAGLLVGVFEELGWTGFALPTVRSQYGILKTGLIIGLIYSVWNFPVVFWVSKATGAAGALPMIVFMPAVLFTWIPACRVLIVWVYEHTGSLLVVMLMHASLIAFWRVFTPLTLIGADLITFYLLFTAALWVFLAVILRLETPSRSIPGIPSVGIPGQK